MNYSITEYGAFLPHQISFPSAEPNPDDANRLLVEGMSKMSFQERTLLMEELHGVADTVDETPELIASSHASLQIELDKITQKPAYNIAYKLSPEYVTDISFRLLFLRANRFDTVKSAHMLARFMDTKLSLWGQAKLVEDISLTDFPESDLPTLQSGCMQILASRDQAGRAVFFDSLVDSIRLYASGRTNPTAVVRHRSSEQHQPLS